MSERASTLYGIAPEQHQAPGLAGATQATTSHRDQG